MIAVIITAVVFLYSSGNQTSTGEIPEIEKPDRRILLIGIDSLNWQVMNPLIEEGRLPNLGKLIAEGTSGVLMSRTPSNSPVVWTTIATGKKREEHGIRSFMKDGALKGGGQTPYTSADRKVAALWNMMGMQDRTVGCFGWWVTWPAEEVNGVMVSAFVSFDPQTKLRRGMDIDEAWERLTYPGSLKDEIEPFLIPADSVTHEDMSRFVDVDDWEHPLFDIPELALGIDFVLPWSYATDLSYVQVAEELIPREKFDLSMVYIQGTDSLSHKFWMCRDDIEGLHENLLRYNLPVEYEDTFRKYCGETIDRYYEFADELVGRLLETIDDKTVVIVCSDHGFGTLQSPWESGLVEYTNYGWHVDEGTVIFWGPGIRQGKELSKDNPPHIWDIAPTILMILEMPLAGDMAGMPVTDAFDAGFLLDYRPAYVASYDVDFEAGERPVEVPLSEEYEERLRSLGYIQ